MSKYPFYRQFDSSDCGPACLRMITKFYGRTFTAQNMRDRSFVNRIGTSFTDLSEAAESIGFRTIMARITFQKLKEESPLPLIVHWNGVHFVVVFECKKDHIVIGDPASGILKVSHEQFKKSWYNGEAADQMIGVTLLLEPTRHFYAQQSEPNGESKWGMSMLVNYLRPYSSLISQLLIGMLAGNILQLFFPLMTQALVDKGIGSNNVSFVQLILIAQLVLLCSRMMLDLIQNRLLLFMNGRLNLSLLSDFLTKIMKLPISFFDSRNMGDILQRLSDNSKIQNFLTGTSLSVIFSLFNLFIFGIILSVYSLKIFAIYFFGSIVHTLWIVVFLKRRRTLNYQTFHNLSRNQNVLIQLIGGMQEIKLHNSERQKRWEWERMQANGYMLGVKSLNLSQYQQTGAFFINETKNVIITFLTVTSVMNGEITLGMMMSIQYIIGSLNSPIASLIGLIQTIQDVKISLERMGDVHHEPNEDTLPINHITNVSPSAIILKNTSFKYGGVQSNFVLKNINLEIPQNKITAIVGTSGSGKSTLLKLMLRLYEPTQGEISMGDTKLNTIRHNTWRSQCAAVMQDGFIFSDTIARNVAMCDDMQIDFARLSYSLDVANINDYIATLPSNYNTFIGTEGVGLSQGQRQRILIARAVYKNPNYLFLDEATNALDSSNESVIMNNLKSFFKNRTVVIVAHRLSTVMSADKIIVIKEGEILESGNHSELVQKRGLYYELIKNQLELGV